MTIPVGPRMEVSLGGDKAGKVTSRESTAAEVADITALRNTVAADLAATTTREQRLAAARTRIGAALTAGQGAQPATVQDLADLFGIDPA